MDTRSFRRLVRRRWRSVLIGTVIVGVLTLIADLLQPPVYQSSATLLVNQNRGLTAPSYESVLMSQQLTRTYAELLKKRPLYEGVIASLNLATSPDRLMRNVRVSTIRDTQLIVVSVRDHSPQRAADIANELVRLLREQDRQLLVGAYAGSERGLSVVEPALPDPVPFSPKVARDVLLGLIFGLLGMFGIAVVREYLDETVKNSDDAMRLTGAPVLGVIRDTSTATQRSVTIDDNVPEPYRMLAVRLRHMQSDHRGSTLLVTGAEPLKDVHAVAAYLAAVSTRIGQRVILVDGDLRQPTLHSFFDLSGAPGLKEALEHTQTLPVYRYLRPTSFAHLMLLPGGEPTANPMILLDSSRLCDIIQELHQHAELVIVVSPALLAFADTLLLAKAADTALLVVRAESTGVAALAAARATLDQASIRMAGVVLTNAIDEPIAFWRSNPVGIVSPVTHQNLWSGIGGKHSLRSMVPPPTPSHSSDT
ncbi:MAG: Wzz/FepE/Etk N-terminal domain-containing protein [Roseiflexus sp.]